MIEFLNQLSQSWYEFYYWSTIQNSLFLLIITGLLYSFRKTNVFLLKILSMAGLAKLLIPPIFEFKISEPIAVPIIETIATQYIVAVSQTATQTIDLSFQSLIMIFWCITVFIILSFIVGQYVKMNWSVII